MIKEYYQLAKPGIIYGNLITAIAGFLFASKGQFNFVGFVLMLIGISLVMAAGCVFNNIYDRDIDAKMYRTQNRAMVKGLISKKSAIIYGSILLLIGIISLYFVNIVSLLVAIVGVIFYLFLYTPLKRYTVFGTLIGAVAGAVPPVVGYTAVAGKIDLPSLLLFLVLVVWQMAHFYSISLYRFEDYSNAQIPVLAVKMGKQITKIAITIFILLLAVVEFLFKFYGYRGYFYLSIVSILTLIWLYMSLKGFNKNINEKLWAKKMFRFSLIVLLVFSLSISVRV